MEAIRVCAVTVQCRVRRLSVILLLACSVLIQSPNLLGAQEGSVIVVGLPGPGPRNVVARYFPETNISREIYRSEGYVRRLTVSGDGRYVGVNERRSGGRSPFDLEDRLVILDPAGTVIRTIRAVEGLEVFDHTWCCGSGRLAVIAGVRKEGAEGGFRPEAAFVIDLSGGTPDRLESIPGPRDIWWVSADSSLYIKGYGPDTARVYRYDARTGTVSITPHHGVFFSPDKMYYFDASREGGGFRLFRAENDQDVTEGLELSPEQVMYGPVGGWMPGEDHVLVFREYAAKPTQPERPPGRGIVPARPSGSRNPSRVGERPAARWNVAINAATGEVVHRFQGAVEALRTNVSALPVERNGRVELVRLR